MATYTTQAIATYSTNGPIVANLGPSQVAVLAANYLANQPNFLRLALAGVNQAVLRAEQGAYEGSMLELVLTGMNGQAGRLASALNQQYHGGNVSLQGEVISPWPGQNDIAFIQDSNTLIIRWRKGIAIGFLYLILGILIAVGLYLVYQLIRSSNYSMNLIKTLQSHGIPVPGQQTNGTNPVSGILSWAVSHWQWVLGGAGVVATVPWVLRKVASTETSVRTIERGGGG